ncbi:MAG: [Solobacterium sp.]|nr:[FeFe] hydrogenase H-cluster maturation GTPase HydF [Solobacterium sp.]
MLNTASSANRTHIGFFGRMNAGKSSLINCFADQEVSIVSAAAGTTTDVVKKPMEIHGIGPCVLLDTAGYDDAGELGEKRIEASRKAMEMCEIAVILYTDSDDDLIERTWIEEFRKRKTPVIAVLSRCDLWPEEKKKEIAHRIQAAMQIPVIACSAVTKEGIEELKSALISAFSERRNTRTITGGLIENGASVMLVMPQDASAPKGRLIQPQAQTIRELLERHCVITCIAPEEMAAALANMKKAPDLIITDSQVFRQVYELTPPESKLTSFSILFAAFKGDIQACLRGAKAMSQLNENSRVLIAECCTHAPLSEDIGRVKIPRMLRKKYGETLQTDVYAGTDFPADLDRYDLIIQCGGCMFNRKYIMSRMKQAEDRGVPITNYGIAIAQLQGILDHVTVPAEEE